MATLNTVFKWIYAEALEPYGYKKIKGRQPYFVRLIGDEIIHIITVAPEPSIIPGERRFGIYGGAATVYRPRINLDITPRENLDWLTSNLYIYRDSDIFEDRPDRFSGKYEFSYEKDNENSLVESVKSSVLATEQVLLEKLKKVTDIRSCMDFFNDFQSLIAGIDSAEFDMHYECNEGLVYFKIFSNADEYFEYIKKRHEQYNERMIYMIEKGMVGWSMESFKQREIEREKKLQKKLEIYKKYISDQNYVRVMEELEKRKKLNLDILRSYGLNV